MCAGRSVWGVLYADESCIVSRSSRSSFSHHDHDHSCSIWLDCLEQDRDHVGTDSLYTDTVQLKVLNALGQEYQQTTSFIYLEGAVPGSLNSSLEVHRRIFAGYG